MKRPRGPLHFVLAVVGCWIAGRGAVLMWSEEGYAEPPSRRAIDASPGAPGRMAVAPAPAALVPPIVGWPEGTRAAASAGPLTTAGTVDPAVLIASPFVNSVEPGQAGSSGERPLFPPSRGLPTAPNPVASRFGGSAWALLREGSGASLAGLGGQLGGSQAGLRLRYALGRGAGGGLALFGRFSAPLEQARGKEAALGLEWRPLAAVPVSLVAERRIGVDKGGRDAFAVGLIGGMDRVALPASFRLDAYAQAGVVGLNRRDAYVDGQVRVERPLFQAGSIEIAIGGGLWGGAQPGAARLDIGPQLVARLPLADRTLRVNLDWRARVVGNARPGSGFALTLATDF